MKKKKNTIIIILSIILLIGIITFAFFKLNDKNKLTVDERRWVDENVGVLQNINVINNINVFGKNGSGVFYDFLEDFSEKYGFQINPITFNIGSNPSGITFNVKKEINDKDVVFYKDHYVLVGKNKEIVSDYSQISNKTIGVLQNDKAYIEKYINSNFVSYESSTTLFEAFNSELNYIVIPLIEYLDKILSSNYNIVYHFSDINCYYTMSTNDSTLSNVFKKYYNVWKEDFEEYFYDSKFNVMVDSLSISETEIDKIQSVVYKYGFVNTSPYEVIMGGEYGGIVAVYLKYFSDLSDVEFNFVKYKSYDKFVSAVENKEIDLYFNYYNFNDEYNETTGPVINYSIIARRDNSKVFNSINSLIGETVYVLKDSKLNNYLKLINGINIITYNNTKELFKLNKKDAVIVLDSEIYSYYSKDELDNYTKRYSANINDNYEFKVKDNDVLYLLLDRYMSVLDYKEISNLGFENHYQTVKTGSIMSRIAEYIIYLVLIAVVVILILIRKSKKITIARKIKRDDKLKFIDQLTSLKNRNFLNENISVWNNNTIYPQTIIVVDLNRVQEINDMHGYNEGDRQIKSAANALIKTQLDNSEIMRTDGNEFVIYLVGYTQKQVGNYIHKLNKEFNKLPYEFGAEFGYSMILDNIKTIEDAMNEAVEDMKKQKGCEINEKQTKK